MAGIIITTVEVLSIIEDIRGSAMGIIIIEILTIMLDFSHANGRHGNNTEVGGR